MPPNQPHRAEVKKMLVHSDGRRQGIAGSMLRRVEEEALKRGRTLLILDTGSEEARRVYERGGWSRFGFVPDFALMPDGGFCDTTFYLKDLSPPRGSKVSGVWSDDPVDLDNRRAWLEERRQAGNPVLVALEAGDVVGFGTYLQFRAWDGFRNAVEHSVYVRSDRRGTGVGSALVEALIARARADGKHVVIGGIEGKNLASLRLHRRAGFIEVGRMPGIGEKFGRRLDLVFVQKQIG
jgi:phosphinothricin acetyltransferase